MKQRVLLQETGFWLLSQQQLEPVLCIPAWLGQWWQCPNRVYTAQSSC